MVPFPLVAQTPNTVVVYRGHGKEGDCHQDNKHPPDDGTLKETKIGLHLDENRIATCIIIIDDNHALSIYLFTYLPT